MNALRPHRRGPRRVALVALAALVATSAALAGGPPAGAQRPPKPESTSPAAELAVSAAAVGGEVVQEPGEPVTAVGAPAGQALPVDGAGSTPRAAAQAFVAQYGAAFGEPDPEQDLTVDRTTPMGAGGRSVHYQQLEGDVPIIAGELNVQVAPGGKVRSAGGELSTGDAVDLAPDVSTSTAAETAVDRVATDAGVDPSVLVAGEPALWVYDPSLVDESGPRRLVWRLEVRSDVVPVRVDVLVDAHSGEVVTTFVRIMEAGKNRQVCDNNSAVGVAYTCPSSGAPLIRSEGGPASVIPDVNNAYDLSGATYDYYSSHFGRDSIDGAGLVLKSTVRHCPDANNCPYQNAFWDGNQMVYGLGFANADDVVAHELTHGVTEYESNLLYANQSGAINESMSDVFGELVDLEHPSANADTPSNRWLMGEDLSIGAIRDMENPPAFGDPARMSAFRVLPNTDAGDWGGVHTNSGIGNKAAALITDGGSFNGVRGMLGIGTQKAARLYYETNANLLTSGTDYAFLGNSLVQACDNLVGVEGFTNVDCAQVRNAVLATEMIPAPAPANDSFGQAVTIAGATGSTAGSTVQATREVGEPCHGQSTQTNCVDFQGTASIWFRFTAPGTGNAVITTCGSDYDTLLAAYTGSAVNALTQRAVNDDNVSSCGSNTRQSGITVAVTQGTTYHLAVDGWRADKGAVTLNWTLPAAPAPTGVSGTVTESGTGTPVPGAMVAVLRSSDLMVSGGGVADGSGNYAVQVPAGSYHLYVIDPSATHVTGFFGSPTLVTVNNGAMTDQDPALASSRGSIAGTVSADSPAGPVPGAWALSVNTSTGATGVGAVANASGQFSLGGLAARNHWAVFMDPTGAHRSEFFPNSTDAAGATPLSVTAGGTAAANVSMANQAAVGTGQTLSGTVTRAGSGSPLSGVWVFALRSSDFTMARGALTNGAGQYSLNVASGVTYKLGFVDPRGVLAMEWFNDQPNNGLATATTVSAGSVNNASLSKVNGSITGTVGDDVSHAPLAGAWALAIDANGKVAGGTVTAADGRFTIAGLAAGPYRVTFLDPVGGRTQEYFDNSSTYAGATVVNVTGGGTATANAELHHP